MGNYPASNGLSNTNVDSTTGKNCDVCNAINNNIVEKDGNMRDRLDGEGGEKPLSQEIIIIPVDHSRQAKRAFEWYKTQMHKDNHYVYVVHCQQVSLPSGKYFPEYAIPPEQWDEKLKKANKGSSDILNMYKDELRKTGISGETYTDFGKPGPMIVESTKQLNASMVVMGTRGLGMFGRTMLGSVSDYVVHNTTLPITVVPYNS